MSDTMYLLLILLLMHTHDPCGSVLVNTKYGQVEGEAITLVDSYHEGVVVNTFYSIPYAKPPVGDWRFQPAREPEPWDEIFQATQLGSACIQEWGRVSNHPLWKDYDEDCLHLNIVTPAEMSEGPYPVMFFIHGGTFQDGANVEWMGHFLAARGVVIVIPNYRVNVFGFAYSGDDVIPGNMGLLDQTLALKFVQENIAYFGGDPNLVTVFGQSAGARSVGLHLMSPVSAGLFHRAILQSGSELGYISVNGPAHKPEGYLEQVAEHVGCPTDNTQLMADCLRSISAWDLFYIQEFECTPGLQCPGFAPVVDGQNGFLPDLPLNIRASGDFNHVTEMIGITRNDEFFVIPTLGVEALQGPNRTEFQGIIRRQVDIFSETLGDREDDVYQAVDFFYTPWPHINDGYSNRQQLGEMLTDNTRGFSSDLQAKHHSFYAPTYCYVYDYISDNKLVPEWLGTTHGSELPYVLGIPFLRYNPFVLNQTKILDITDYNELDEKYSFFMMELWTNFAKYGNPTPEPVHTPEGFDKVTWPEFREDHLEYMYFGKECVENRADYRQQEYAFWREYVHGYFLKTAGD